MTLLKSLAPFFCLCPAVLPLLAQPAPPAKATDKAAAYYHYALGHLYAELAGSYGNRGDYVSKAIENYRLAMKDDPSATFLSDELSDIYIQSGKLRDGVVEAEDALKQNPNDTNARRVLGRIYTRMIGDSQQGRVNEEMLKKAVEQYQKITEQSPDDAETWLMLGRLQKIAQNSVEAEKAYKKVLALDENNEDALTGLAMVYSDLGDTKRATELLRKVTEKNPSARALSTLASAYEQMRDYPLAAETLKRSLELSPDNLEVKKAYAQNLLLSDQFPAALKVYEQLVQEDPKDVQSQLRISQIYRQQKNFAKAKEAGAKAKQMDPANLEVRYNDVNLLEAEGKLPEAIAALRDLVTSTAKRSYSSGEKGNRVVLLERLAMMSRSNEQYSEAIETFRQVPEVDPELGGRAAAQIMDTYRAAKDFKKAAEEADAAAKKYPADRVVRAVRASILADVGRTNEAVEETRKLLDGKNDRDTYVSLAQIYEKARNFAEMEKAIIAAEKLSDSKEDKESIAFLRGAMYEKMKNFEAAEAEFRKVLAGNPTSPSALNYLGYMLADRNVKLQEAQQLISKALEADPNNGAYLDSLGWVYYRMDRLPEAENALRRAMERYSKDPTVHDHLGDVLFKQGKLKEAIAQWQSSLKEWEATAPSEADPAEVAKIQRKLESARVRLAKESSAGIPKQQ
ncbi:MAG TPA: tetratricopeptide repeat protein [Bryobacteraceae bacterium]|nr:tetratricopeptide repeat protein [Bryobacteraceae bacterium]